jgi:hypothetical protein
MKWLKDHIGLFITIMTALTIIVSSAVGVFSYYQGVQAERLKNTLRLDDLEDQDLKYITNELTALQRKYDVIKEWIELRAVRRKSGQ